MSGSNSYITWSSDGTPTRTLKAANANTNQWKALSQPQALLLDLKVNGEWNKDEGRPLSSGAFSHSAKLDYVKVLKLPVRQRPSPGGRVGFA